MTFDEKFIEEFMPSLMNLVKKYANEEHDEDELLSDGQMAMLDYLSNKEHCKNKNLKKNLYESLNRKLKNISTTHDDNKVEFDEVTFGVIRTYDPDKLIDYIKEFLTDREFDLLTSYYGIFTYRKTLETLSKEFKLSREGVRWIIRRSENKVRQAFEENGLSFEDLF